MGLFVQFCFPMILIGLFYYLVGYTHLAVAMVEVLMGVRRLGVKIDHQTVPVTRYFGVEECYRLFRPLGGELYCGMKLIDFINKLSVFPRRVARW